MQRGAAAVAIAVVTTVIIVALAIVMAVIIVAIVAPIVLEDLLLGPLDRLLPHRLRRWPRGVGPPHCVVLDLRRGLCERAQWRFLR